MSGSELIFALDIGTRSVMGLVGHYTENGLEVMATHQLEHVNRSMLDGQIHDVVEVARVITQVKEALEQHAGPLSKVAVAAAGRALKTVRSKVERESNGERLTRDDVLAMELTAVQQAEHELQKLTADASRYHCVAYTVVHYMLDDSPIGSLVGQLGITCSVEIIVTFLPRVVIDSLQYALEHAGLEMAALTLEPIAAINALIPDSMRKLNLALVDIGAGTSDIAITAEGTVTAYGMVPVAGDEITEALSHKYLLDFPVAETVKRSLLQMPTVAFTDVLGMSYECSSADVITSIETEVTELARKIMLEIRSLNGASPQAVMLVGGGSQTPLLREKLAELLQLPKERVVIRGADAIGKLLSKQEPLSGPGAVTPVGIALAAVTNPISSVSVRVNGHTVHLFEFRQVTVGDALLAAEIDSKKLHGRPGMAISVEVNGLLKVLKGTLGTPATLQLNGEAAHLDTLLQHGDEIVVHEGQAGIDGGGTIADVLPEIEPMRLQVNGKPTEIFPVIMLNGKPADLLSPLPDRAEITVHQPEALLDILSPLGYSAADFRDKTMTVTVNGEARSYTCPAHKAARSGKPLPLHEIVHDGDSIVIHEPDAVTPVIENILKDEEKHRNSLQVVVNGKRLQLYGPAPSIELNGLAADLHTPLTEFARISIRQEPWMPVFSHIFQYVHIDRERPANAADLRLEHNGAKADFSAPLHDGDVITVEWQLKDSSNK